MKVGDNQVIWILTTTGSFFICLGLGFIDNPTLRKFYSTLTGLFVGFYFNGASYLFIIFTWVMAYLIAVTLPRRQAVYAATIFTFLALLTGHFWHFT